MNDPDKAQLEQTAHHGIEALRRGDGTAARQAFERIVASGRATLQVWLFLAQACDLQDDRPAARAALEEVLKLDQSNPYALVMQGELYTRDGDDRAASNWYDWALSAAATMQGLPPDLLARLQRADAERAAAISRFRGQMDAALSAAGVAGDAAGPRFAESLSILSGQTRPYLQEPTSFYFPGLPQQAFFDPADFAWSAALEAAMPAIRAEATAAVAGREGVGPYVERPKDRPAKPHTLLDDPRWSAFHLWKAGAPVEENASRCPATMKALAGVPIPEITGRSPTALFSILAPGTHIVPHNGMLNTRLICHLPLIVPPNCRLRVGNHTRSVEAGKLMIFDDSIEHEAWNDSGEMRVILLFEIWRPELTAGERSALTAMYETVSGYGN